MNPNDLTNLADAVGATCHTHSMGRATSIMFSMHQLEQFVERLAEVEQGKHQHKRYTMKKHPYAEILRAIADGKQVQQFAGGHWMDMNPDTALLSIGRGSPEFRIKPTTITVNGIEVPEPLRDFSTIRDYYWIVSPFKGACMITYCADKADQHALNAGLCHATEEAAQAHFEAIISTSKRKEGTQ